MFRAVVIENDRLVGQQLATLLEDTCLVEVVGVATEGNASLRLCYENRPDVAFVDAKVPGCDGGWLPAQLSNVEPPPRLVLTSENAGGAVDAFRLEAVDYLLKPLDPARVAGAVDRLMTCLYPFRNGAFQEIPSRSGRAAVYAEVGFADIANEFLPVTGVDRDQIRLLSRREIVAVVRRDRRTWIHTVLEEFATYYPLADLMRWLGGDPFLQVGRHAVVNIRAIDQVERHGDRLHRVRLRDRANTEITASRTGTARLTEVLKPQS